MVTFSTWESPNKTRLLFEQNDNTVRQQFLDSVNPILDAIRRDRGLYDFRVTVQNTPEDLDANQLVGKIYIKPTKALEFIDIEFLITPFSISALALTPLPG